MHRVVGVKIYAPGKQGWQKKQGWHGGSYTLPAVPTKASHPALQEAICYQSQKVTLNTPWPGHLDKWWTDTTTNSCVDSGFMIECPLV